MVVQGIVYLRRILEYRDAKPSGNAYLDMLSGVPMGKQDVPDAIHIARQGIATIDAEDPAQLFLRRVAAFERRDRRYDRNDPARILRICDEGVLACECAFPDLQP